MQSTRPTPPPLRSTGEHLHAYVRYRMAGGLVLTVARPDASGLHGIVLMTILDQFGWHGAGLDADVIPATALGHQLIRYGYMRANHIVENERIPEHGEIAGWTPLDGRIPGEGRAIEGLEAPRWTMPVYRLTGGDYDQHLCNLRDPGRSYCLQCPPERQQAVYLRAVARRPK